MTSPYISEHDIAIAARTIFGEARSEDYQSQRAVAHVIINRWKSGRKRWNTIVKVCTDYKQFSCWNAGDPNLWKLGIASMNDPVLRSCFRAFLHALDEDDFTNGARHYHTKNMGWPRPWGEEKEPCYEGGSHLFYNNVK